MFGDLIQKLANHRRRPKGKARGTANQPEVDDDPDDDITQEQKEFEKIVRQEEADDKAEEAGTLVDVEATGKQAKTDAGFQLTRS